ncbi:hypothetical protein MG293_010321 [Ovis ammon polii]|uniref:Uncharacterized protein n=1 Tax=Ovis ammon polii TaxID=230172 RepID=A0AAD4U7J9_OVIAM|nr:hypothetical protein MG293_010321 [Ovis ammon polii]
MKALLPLLAANFVLQPGTALQCHSCEDQGNNEGCQRVQNQGWAERVELNFSSTVDWPSTADKQVCTLVLSGQQATSSRQRGGDQGVHGSMKALNRDWLGQKGTQSCCRWIRDLCMELLGSGPRGGVQLLVPEAKPEKQTTHPLPDTDPGEEAA